jgi:uncharacterized membrane protein (GlpM family)
VCALYASNWLPYAHCKLTQHKIFDDLLPYTQFMLAIGYCMCIVRLQFATVCAVNARKFLCTDYTNNCYRTRNERKLFVSVCTVYASKLLPHVQYTLTKNKIIRNLLPYAQCTLAIYYRMRIVRKQLAAACAVCVSNLLPYAQCTLTKLITCKFCQFN